VCTGVQKTESSRRTLQQDLFDDAPAEQDVSAYLAALAAAAGMRVEDLQFDESLDEKVCATVDATAAAAICQGGRDLPGNTQGAVFAALHSGCSRTVCHAARQRLWLLSHIALPRTISIRRNQAPAEQQHLFT
jgi:hypothetical protein